MSSPREPSEWVNAVVEVTFVLDDVPVGAENRVKQDALRRFMEVITAGLPDDIAMDVVMSGHWEDARDVHGEVPGV